MRQQAPMVERRWGILTSLGSRIPFTSLIQTLVAAEHQSFRQAAMTLGISQSSMSIRIRALEEELGIALFYRNTQGIRLTEAGRHFVEGISAGIDQIDHSVKTAGAFTRGTIGRIRIGVHALTPGGFLDGLLARYRKAYPGVTIDITEETACDCIRQIRALQLDIAFVAGVPELTDCHSRRIWHERLLAALPTGHVLADKEHVTWDDLTADTFLVRLGGTGPQAYEHILHRLSGRWAAGPSIQRYNVERDTLMQMVAQGFGVSIAGQTASTTAASGVIFRPFSDEPEPIPFSAVWSPLSRSPTLRGMLDLARKLGRSAKAV